MTAVLALGVGCSSIRVVERTPSGGTVALHGPEGGAREKADEYIREQCTAQGYAGYEVVEEGEAVVGSETTSRTQMTTIGPVTTAQTSDTREWRLSYRCSAANRTHVSAVQSVAILF